MLALSTEFTTNFPLPLPSSPCYTTNDEHIMFPSCRSPIDSFIDNASYNLSLHPFLKYSFKNFMSSSDWGISTISIPSLNGTVGMWHAPNRICLTSNSVDPTLIHALAFSAVPHHTGRPTWAPRVTLYV